jgi:hypothetical protein
MGLLDFEHLAPFAPRRPISLVVRIPKTHSRVTRLTAAQEATASAAPHDDVEREMQPADPPCYARHGAMRGFDRPTFHRSRFVPDLRCPHGRAKEPLAPHVDAFKQYLTDRTLRPRPTTWAALWTSKAVRQRRALTCDVWGFLTPWWATGLALSAVLRTRMAPCPTAGTRHRGRLPLPHFLLDDVDGAWQRCHALRVGLNNKHCIAAGGRGAIGCARRRKCQCCYRWNEQ